MLLSAASDVGFLWVGWCWGSQSYPADVVTSGARAAASLGWHITATDVARLPFHGLCPVGLWRPIGCL